jgi:hypothetical protein
VKKHNFDQTPILLENFDQVIRSSEIRSSDPLSHKQTIIFFISSNFCLIQMLTTIENATSN